MRAVTDAPHRATDLQSLFDLAEAWRETEWKMWHDHGNSATAPFPGDAPALLVTAVQLEWAAREIERLREVVK